MHMSTIFKVQTQLLVCSVQTLPIKIECGEKMYVNPIPRSTNLLKHISFGLKSFAFFSTNPIQSQQQQFHLPELELKEEERIENNRAHWSKKIHNLCTKKGCQVDEAICLLDNLRLRGYSPDSLNLNSIIHALCASKRFSEAHQRLLFYVSSNSVPDERTCNVLIACLLHARTPLDTLRVVRSLIAAKPAFVPSLINYNCLIHQLCSSRRLLQAHQLFFDMKSRGHVPSTISYTALINGFCENREMGVAHDLFDEMLINGVVANPLTYSVLLKGVLRRRDVQQGRKLMEKLWKRMIDEEDKSVNNAAFANLIGSLCREGFFHEVYRIAEEMPQRESVDQEFAYGQMIDSLCRAEQNHGASRIVYIMRMRGFVPSFVSYNLIVHGLSKEGGGGPQRAYQLFKEGTQFGYLPSEHTYKVLVECLCQESDINKARDLLQFMVNKEGVDKTRIYNIFLRALCHMGNPSELLNVLVSMLQNQCPPDVVTLNTVINGLCKMRRVNEALKVLNDMLTGNLCSPDVVTFTTVIYGLLSDGRTDEALHLLLKKMPEMDLRPNVVTYNAVLRGLCVLQKVDEALQIFNDMVSDGVVADRATYTILIEGLCGCNRIDEAKRFWENVVWPSKAYDDFVYAAILKGLCGSGKLDEACDFLYELVDSGLAPNIVNYNILIDAACKLGLKKEAYQILGEMKKNRLTPDAVTWRILDKLHNNVGSGVDHDVTSKSKDDVGTHKGESTAVEDGANVV